MLPQVDHRAGGPRYDFPDATSTLHQYAGLRPEARNNKLTDLNPTTRRRKLPSSWWSQRIPFSSTSRAFSTRPVYTAGVNSSARCFSRTTSRACATMSSARSPVDRFAAGRLIVACPVDCRCRSQPDDLIETAFPRHRNRSYIIVTLSRSLYALGYR